MARTRTRTGTLLAIVFLFVSQATFADEALPQLKGVWQFETQNGEALPDFLKIQYNFVDDDKLLIIITDRGETHEEEAKYKATKDGKITIIDDGVDQPGTWEIKNGKLILKTSAGEPVEMVFSRPPK